MEEIIRNGHIYLASCFREASGRRSKKKQQPRGAGPLGEIDDERRDLFRQSRNNAVHCLGDIHFIIKCMCSSVCQSPLRHFYAWLQKRAKDFNEKKEADPDHVYLGATPLSDLVAYKSKEIRSEFDDLLVEGRIHFSHVWPLVPQRDVMETRALIVSLAATGACQYDMRVASLVEDITHLLLLCVEYPPHIEDDRRREVAKMLLGSCEHCLEEQRQDFTLKLLRRYRASFEQVAESGRIPVHLHTLIQLTRAVWQENTQKVEGANSCLQNVCKAAPNIHLPLASDRISLKCGTKVSIADCVAMHSDVVLRQSDEKKQPERWATIPECDIQDLAASGASLGGAAPASCEHKMSCMMSRLAKGMQSHLADTLTVTASTIVALELRVGSSLRVTEKLAVGPFVLGCTHFKTLWRCKASACTPSNTNQATGFQLQVPLQTFKIKDALLQALNTWRGLPSSEGKSLKRLVVFAHRVQWESLQWATIKSTSSKSVSPKPAAATPSKTPRLGPHPATASDEFEVPDDDEDFDLEQGLVDIMADEEGEGGSLIGGQHGYAIPDICWLDTLHLLVWCDVTRSDGESHRIVCASRTDLIRSSSCCASWDAGRLALGFAFVVSNSCPNLVA